MFCSCMGVMLFTTTTTSVMVGAGTGVMVGAGTTTTTSVMVGGCWCSMGMWGSMYCGGGKGMRR